MGWKITPEKGAIYVFDKGYYDYSWWHQFDQAEAIFVTRFKKNAAVSCLEDHPVPHADHDIIEHDQSVVFKNRIPRGGCVNPYVKPLRRIVVQRPDHKTPLILATNDFTRTAAQIAQDYRTRWAIELWFKWIKQRLKIKAFLGRSENAVRIQIAIALITFLLADQYRQLHQFKPDFYLWLAEFKATLFTRIRNDYAERKSKQLRQLNLLQYQASLPI